MIERKKYLNELIANRDNDFQKLLLELEDVVSHSY